MGISKNTGTPKSSILIGFSIINYPFWDTGIPLFSETPTFWTTKTSVLKRRMVFTAVIITRTSFWIGLAQGAARGSFGHLPWDS